MRYFKNSELVRMHGVSDKTVRNWIASASEGKLDLKLYVSPQGKKYIADSIANNQQLRKLVEDGRKFRNNRNYRSVTPSSDLQRMLSTSQIVQLVNTLEKEHELSWNYSYFGDSASYWDTYLKELVSSGKGNLVTNTIDTLAASYDYIDSLIQGYKHVNVVNVCIGNNLAVKDVVRHIYSQGKLNRCIAIDISPDVLEIADSNVNKWYDGHIKLEKYQRDIRYNWFGDILVDDPAGRRSDEIINLVFFVAGPITNFKWPEQTLHTVCDSMSVDDLLFVTKKRDTEETSNFFDFNIKSDTSLSGYGRDGLAHLVGLETGMYEVEQLYDPTTKTRSAQLRLKYNIDIEFESGSFKRTVHLRQGDALRLWKSSQYTDSDFLNVMRSGGFDVLHMAQSKDQQLISTISRVRKTY